jgi:sugar/nucleoside kinase (ribokinase family)
MDLVTIGDVMIDVSVEASAIAHGGDVHGRVLVRPGGSATNAAVWAAAHGARVRVHARVGDDPMGRLVAGALAERGVDAVLVADRGAATGTMLVVRGAGERSVVADRAAGGRLSPDDLPEEIEAGAVLVSGYTLLHEPTMPAACAALERARARYVAVDAASWSQVEIFGADRFFEATSSANVLFANDREAAVLSGASGEDAAEILAGRYPVVCVKRGGRGAVMSWEGLLISYASEPVKEVDATGAGDAFDGALLARLVAGASPGDALHAACSAGARVAASPHLWPVEA